MRPQPGTAVDDPILALHREAMERQRTGKPVINATVGALLTDEGQLAILPTAARALGEVSPEEWAAYAPIFGREDFLAAVCGEVFRRDALLQREAVVVATPGGSGAIHLAVATSSQPGDQVLTGDLHWSPYRTLCEAQGRTLATFRMFDGDGTLDLEALDRALRALLERQGRALLILNDPCHNPTGYSMTDQDWIGLVDLVSRRAEQGEIAVMLDHAYAAYSADGGARAVAHLCRLRGRARVLVAWSASKSYALYGLRVGALLALAGEPAQAAALRHRLGLAVRGTWSNCNAGGMAAVARLLSDPALRADVERERDALRELLGARAALFHQHVAGTPLRPARYDGGFFATVGCERPDRACADLKTVGVFVVPQTASLRVALSAVRGADLPRLVGALAEAA